MYAIRSYYVLPDEFFRNPPQPCRHLVVLHVCAWHRRIAVGKVPASDAVEVGTGRHVTGRRGPLGDALQAVTARRIRVTRRQVACEIGLDDARVQRVRCRSRRREASSQFAREQAVGHLGLSVSLARVIAGMSYNFV